MSKYLIISLLFFLNGCSIGVKEFNKKDIIFTNGLWTEKFSDELITGKVYKFFGEKDNLKKVYIGNLLNGKEDGLWTKWYDNGQKSNEETYKDGKLDGLWTIWYENGQKKYQGTYKDGKEDGLHTIWFKNGQKNSEGTYKDGEKDGLSTGWYENGQKRKEWYYKDGDLVKVIGKWNEDGSVKE